MANLVNIVVDADTKKANTGLKGLKENALGIGLAVAGIGAAFVKISDDFTKSSRTIQAGTGATGKELERLEKSFRNVVAQVPQGFEEVSQAVADVNTKMGISGSALEDTTKAFLDLARVTGSDVSPMIATVSDSMAMFEVPMDQARHTLNQFLAASQASGIGVNQLASRMQEFGPVLNNLDMTMEESIAFFSQLEGAGISASRIMPALNASMRRLAGAGVEDLRGALFAQMEQIKAAESSTEALSRATELFGAEGAQRMKVAIENDLIPSIQIMSKELQEADDQISELGAMTTLGEELAKLRDKLKVVGEPLGDLMESFGLLAIAIGTVGPHLFKLKGLIAPVIGVFGALAAGVSAGALAMAAGIAAVLLTIGWIIWAIYDWESATQFLKDALDKVEKFLNENFNLSIKDAWQNMKDWASEVKGNWKDAWDGLNRGFQTTDRMLGNVEGAVGSFVKGAWAALVEADWDKAWEHFKDAGTEVKHFFLELWNVMPQWVKDGVGAMKEAFLDFRDWMYDLINNISEGLNNLGEFEINIPESIKGIPIPGLGGKSFKIDTPDIGMLQKPQRESDEMLELLHAQEGRMIINFHGNTYGFDDFEEQVSRAVSSKVRGGGYQGVIPSR